MASLSTESLNIKLDIDEIICNYCYKLVNIKIDNNKRYIKNCTKCQVKYCSEECYINDVKTHKIWCGSVTATCGVDYEMKEAGS
jgi:hypothetical protein